MTFCNCLTSLESRDPESGRGLPNARAVVKNKQTNEVSIFYIPIVFCAKYIEKNNGESNTVNNCGRKSKIKYPFFKTETVKIF